jgi:transposase
MSQRKLYSKEFKVAAVRRILDEKAEVAVVARELQVNTTMLYRWKEEYLSESERAFPGNGNSPLSEVEQLRRELEQVKMERDILKKAVGIFSQARQ